MTPEFAPADPARFDEACRRFDQANAADPNTELVEGALQPRELAYAQRLTRWVLCLAPNASEALRLAARCQHLCRWKVPRSSHAMTRAGYLAWREGLKAFHAQLATEILRAVGYPVEVVARVRSLNLKSDFPRDPEARVLEDALCLVFLEHQLAPLLGRSSEEKVLSALRKTWKKMTPAAHALAKELPLGPRERALLEEALAQ